MEDSNGNNHRCNSSSTNKTNINGAEGTQESLSQPLSQSECDKDFKIKNRFDEPSCCTSSTASTMWSGTIQTQPRPQARAAVVGVRTNFQAKTKGIKNPQRTKSFWFRNPSGKFKKCYQQDLKAQLENHKQKQPLFNQDEPLILKLLFYMRRPNSHFVNSKRTNALKKQYRDVLPNTCDLDNLCKLFMDSAQGILYKNDKQVKKLSTMMVYRNSNGKCIHGKNDDFVNDDNGCIEYKIGKITEVKNVVSDFLYEMSQSY